jgi:GNAT superfamily N-acetyltransferase
MVRIVKLPELGGWAAISESSKELPLTSHADLSGAPLAPTVSRAEPADPLTKLDAIFFASATTQHFASDEARSAFHDLWLGRYLRHFPDWCFAALDEAGDVCGYLAGSPVSNAPPLSGPDYFAAFPADMLLAFPAHIHVNVDPNQRGRRIGEALIAAFRAQCRSAGLPGFHAVTAAGSRSAHFFERCGLEPRGIAAWRDRRLAFLGDALD